MKFSRSFAVLLSVLALVACTPEEPVSPQNPSSEDVEILKGISSLNYIPEYEDHCLCLRLVRNDEGIAGFGDLTASFEVRPESMAADLASAASRVLSLKVNYSGKGAGTVIIPVSSAVADGPVLTVTISSSDIPESFLSGKYTLNATLIVKAGNVSVDTDPIGLRVAEYLSVGGSLVDVNNTLYGVVTDSSTGKGIAGVPVTDGYKFVVTDANGVYQMIPDEHCRKVYLSLPAAYKVPLNAKHLPQIYSAEDVKLGELFRYDFNLEPLDESEENFTLMMISDPQCSKTSHVSRYVNETIADIKTYISAQQSAGRYRKCYAFTLGDIISDSSTMWDNMVNSMSDVKATDGYLPFFQCMGNHDHDATVEGTYLEGDFNATHYFFEKFGPSDYSINRGNVHIIVMDDILVSTPSANTSVNGKTWGYNVGYNEKQMEWLRQDLELVPDKENKMVVLCQHIQIRGTQTNHCPDILSMLTQFKEAHIMIGHTHYCHNYIHSDYVCKGGQPIYEHIHGAACGSWWSCNSQVSGGANCYNLYEVTGSTMKNWIVKPTKRDPSYQMRVFDGNQSYTGKKSYIYNWYNKSNVGGASSIVAKGVEVLKGCFVAEVWNDDAQNWKVEFWQNGKYVGDFKRISDGTCSNAAMCSYYFNELGKNSTHYVSYTASHYWYYKPASETPATETGWEVKAIQTIPSSGVKNTFSRNSLTTNYSEF